MDIPLNFKKPWSEQDKQFIEDNYRDMTTIEISSILGRTNSGVISMVFELGLGKQKIVEVGQKFTRLLVLEKLGIRKKVTWFKCLCDCGNVIQTAGNRLNSQHTRSCGCLKQDENVKRLKKQSGEVSFNNFYKSYKRGALDRNLPFELTKDQFIKIVTQNCHYTGKSPRLFNPYLDKNKNRYGFNAKVLEQTIKDAEIYVNGIDRKDNNLGYTLENCVPCASGVNWAKRSMSYENFIQMAYDIVNHQEKMKELAIGGLNEDGTDSII